MSTDENDELYLWPLVDDKDWQHIVRKGHVSDTENRFIASQMFFGRKYLKLWFEDDFDLHSLKFIGKRTKYKNNMEKKTPFVEYWFHYKPTNEVFRIRKEFRHDGAWMKVYTYILSEEGELDG